MSEQIREWKGAFGREYTDRNLYSPEELNAFYKKTYGVTRRELNEQFIGDLPRDIKILEVGSNVGNQIELLQEMGFQNLFGIDVNRYAIEASKKRLKDVSIFLGSAQSIPFEDNFFDLVFTSGVLIHIPATEIQLVFKEICRCTKKYIWGFEYFSEEYTEINYRGEGDLLWKAYFSKLYQNTVPGLEMIREKKVPYLNDENVDMMFLLKKSNTP